jgi:WD40 repeat protein
MEDTGALVRPVPTTRFDAFMSYSHPDRDMAAKLQHRVEQLAKPWYKRRNLRVFRDEASLAAGSKLWPPIEVALTESAFLLVLASPAAAHSEWVERETGWWIANRSTDRIILAVVDGELTWSATDGTFDAARTTCLPHSVASAFTEEPHWVDLRGLDLAGTVEALLSPAAAIVAAITGTPKDELLGEDLRQHQRTRRTAVGALALISILLVVAVIAAVTALGQRDSARSNAAIATSRTLGAESDLSRADSLQQSLLLAAASADLHSDFASSSALFKAVSYNPYLSRFLTFPGPVNAEAWTTDPASLVTGGNGYVAEADPTTGTVRTLAVRGSVRTLAVSYDGDTVLAGTSDGHVLAIDFTAMRQLWDVSVTHAAISALSANGAAGQAMVTAANGEVALLQGSNGQTVHIRRVVTASDDEILTYASFTTDADRLIVGDTEGSIEEISAATLLPVTTWSTLEGPLDTAPPFAYTAAGGSLTYSYADKGFVSVDSITGPSGSVTFPSSAFSDTSTFALSNSRTLAAVDADGSLQLRVAQTRANPDGSILDLSGVPSADAQLAFSVDGALLAESNGSSVALWHTSGTGGVAHALPDIFPSPCEACGGTAVASDTAAHTLIWQQWPNAGTGNNEEIVCWDTTANRARERFNDPSLGALVHQPSLGTVQTMSISPDGTHLVTTNGQEEAVEWRLRNGCPSGAPEVLGHTSVHNPSKVLELADRTLIGVSSSGTLTHIAPDGTVTRTWPASSFNAPTAAEDIATSPEGTAFVSGRYNGTLAGYTARAGTIEKRWTSPSLGAQITSISYVSPTEIVAADLAGTVELLNAETGHPLRTLSGAMGYIASASSDGQLIVGITGGQDTAAIWSAADGSLLDTIDFAPVGLPNSLRVARASTRFATVLVPDGSDHMWFFEAGTAPTRWDLNASSWRTIACNEAGGTLTAAEWEAATGVRASTITGCVASATDSASVPLPS